MLNPEDAQKRLKEFRLPDGGGRRLIRAAELPPELRAAAFGLLERDPEGKAFGMSSWQKKQKAQADAFERLHAASPESRLRIFEVLFPGIAPVVARMWDDAAHKPYQVGWGRKPFRTPGRSETATAAQVQSVALLIDILKDYEQDIRWIAAWAPYLAAYNTDPVGDLLAAAIDAGGPDGEAVFNILLDSARGEHEIGSMGEHVTRALLAASRPDGWEFMRNMLLAAQRQEGLRQSILEKVDEAHPDAFRLFLRTILEHDLLRFSATLRALDVWTGFQFEVATAGQARATLAQISLYLEDPGARRAALCGEDGKAAYLALWSLAFDDALAAVAAAEEMLHDPSVEKRFAATYLLSLVNLHRAKVALLPALDDPDLRVAMTAFGVVSPSYHAYYDEDEESEQALEAADLFERLERLIARCPKAETELPEILWPWMKPSAGQATVAAGLLRSLGKRPASRLLPYLSMMEPWTRARAAELLAKKPGEGAVREALFGLARDPAEAVRSHALKAIAKLKVKEEEAQDLEGLLSRKSGDVRRGVYAVLLNQSDERALGSADRLLSAKNANQRLGGLELLAELRKAERQEPEVRARARAYHEARTAGGKALPESEQGVLDTLLDVERETPTLENALGLMDPARRTPVERPKEAPGVLLQSEAAPALLKSLDDLVHAHRKTEVTIRRWDEGEEQQLLGDVSWGFPDPGKGVTIEEDAARLPLREVWEAWWRDRPAETRDPDGRELLRTWNLVGLGKVQKLKHAEVTTSLVQWLLRLFPPPGAPDFLLDAAETVLAQVPADLVARKPKEDSFWDMGWRGRPERVNWLAIAREHRAAFPEQWTDEHHRRMWKLFRWLDEPAPDLPRLRPNIEDVGYALRAGAATEADVFDLLIGPRPVVNSYYIYNRLPELQALSARKCPTLDLFPELKPLVDRARERILEVELARGDIPTAATLPALSLRYSGGMDTLVRLLQAFGKGTFVRGWAYADDGKNAVFSRLLRATFPKEGETPEAFAARVKGTQIPEKRLIETAFYAPQWASHVEAAIGWDQFAEAVWWVHAHTKDEQWSVDEEIREAWTAQVAERTPLSAQSLVDGAVDVAWFHRIRASLGDERWKAVDDAAKYASGGGGHKRAQLFADAMLGRVTREHLVTQMEEKRNKDAVRALGLLPLAHGEAGEHDLLDRYQKVQEFLRGSRQFGSMRQASEKLASSIALENLARTAGYPDPVRLEWAMEARAIADLAEGALTATAGEVEVTLSINEWGEADLTVTKAGKPLKSIPPAVKKDPAIAALSERKTAVKRQSSRMRLSLENAAIRGDRFSARELRDLFAHPVLAPMLRNLVFVACGDAGSGSRQESGLRSQSETTCIGYLVAGGAALERHDGEQVPVSEETPLRLAHPHDLLATGEWHLWQRDCFRRERIQPFKQVFRELYVLTAAEQKDGVRSVRYAGHQVNSNQARALLGKRGWISNPEEGDVRRTFHDHGLTAWLEFDYGWTTPAEVEGLTIDCVGFSRRGEWTPLPLEEVPPRVFSEVMRDVDLVVSVAHQGGVDPEATASTVEMRASILRETLPLLRLDNVQLKDSHALINGKLGDYSVHLGSAVVHRQPGGHLCIVPVHSQHRGRIFLPFADSDPRTAEVVSKVLLLAKDTEIKDPTILEQIYGSARRV